MSRPEPRKPLWRDFCKIHPRADDYPLLEDEELEKLAKRIDKDGLRVPIQTRRVAGEDHSYVIDGRNRLDAMEKVLGWQIVDDEGNWYGALAFVSGTKLKVEHKDNYTHEQIIAEIDDLNFHRRHLNESQRSLLGAKRATATRGGDRKSDQSVKRSFDQMTEAEAAKKFKVSESSIQRAKKVMAEAPDKVADIKAGNLRLGKAASELPAKSKSSKRKELPFADEVRKKWTQWLNRFQHAQRNEVMTIVVEWIGTNPGGAA